MLATRSLQRACQLPTVSGEWNAVRFQPERPAPGTHGLSALPPRLLATVLLHDQRGFMATAFLTRNRTDGNKRSAASPGRGRGRPRPVFQSAHRWHTATEDVAVQFFCGQGRHEKSQVRQRILRLPFRQRKNAHAYGYSATCYPDGGVFRSPPPPAMRPVLCAERNQCL